MTTDIRETVRERYGDIAEGKRSGCCGPGGCAEVTAPADTAERLGYTADQLEGLPEGADLGLGCGNPVAYAALKPGETVLDLGSGAGIDCFIAAREVGPSGRVIGVDMTPSMNLKARENAKKGSYANVEFRLGEIEHLPLADATVDVVISNCVINLSPEKDQVFREAFRALKPGGRLVVSDLVLLHELPEAVKSNVELYVGCVAGASKKEEYLEHIRRAGFTGVEILNESSYTIGAELLDEGSGERAAFDAVTSVKVRAYKPGA